MLPTHKGSYPQPAISFPEMRALVITTSHSTLDTVCSETGETLKTGKPTGVYSSEMTEPYYVFLDAGLEVDLASIKGGQIPIEKMSLNPLIRTRFDSRFLKDADALAKAENSLAIADLDFTAYDIIFLAGGWGAAYDLAQSIILSQKISEAYAKGILMGSVCHGALGFIGGPKHPETELRQAGAQFESRSKLVEMTANHVVVDLTHRIVSAQNQKGGVEAAVKALELLAKTYSENPQTQAA